MLGKKNNGFVKKKFSFKIVLIVIAALFVLALAEGSFYSVKEQEQAILTMFGKVMRVDTAGLYFKIPFIQQVHLVDMTTHGIGIGYVLKDGQNITVDDEGVMITSDFNFVDIDFYLEYKVSDPVAAYYNSEDTELIMKNMALASIRNTVHVTECALAGADIATVPYSVIEQMTKHPLTDIGIERFQKDYLAVFGK